jgi:hypothetical protein
LRLEPVDGRHVDSVAVVHGPLALFSTGDRFALHHQRDLMLVRQSAPGSAEWTLNGVSGATSFKPYFALDGRPARLYQRSIRDVA